MAACLLNRKQFRSMRTTAKNERLEIRKEDKSMVKYVFKRLGYILVTLWIHYHLYIFPDEKSSWNTF